MKERRYTIILRPEPEGGFSVTVPALPGCVTQGETMEEAVAMAKDAIRIYIESLVSDGDDVPEETAPATALIVTVAA